VILISAVADRSEVSLSSLLKIAANRECGPSETAASACVIGASVSGAGGWGRAPERAGGREARLVGLMTAGARRNPCRGAASTLSGGGRGARERAPPHGARRSTPSSVSAGRRRPKVAREKERQTDRQRGTGERASKRRERSQGDGEKRERRKRKREREARQGDRGEEETRSESPFASAVRCFRGIGRSNGERNRRRTHRSPPVEEEEEGGRGGGGGGGRGLGGGNEGRE